jgi:hypothetical protein
MGKRGGVKPTSKPALFAQTLSPAALTIAALSTWPLLTRLFQISGKLEFSA